MHTHTHTLQACHRHRLTFSGSSFQAHKRSAAGPIRPDRVLWSGRSLLLRGILAETGWAFVEMGKNFTTGPVKLTCKGFSKEAYLLLLFFF